MKKFLIVVFSLLFGFVFTSCGGDEPVTDATDFPGTETPDTPDDDPDNSMRAAAWATANGWHGTIIRIIPY